MASGVVFCPHPPALVPVVAQAAAAELDDLRAAARAAIVSLATPGADIDDILVIGSGPGPRWHEPTARGTLAGYGVELEIGLGSDAGGPIELPLSLTIGAFLLRDALGPGCGATGYSVGAVGPIRARPRHSGPARPGLILVMGDGSARRSLSAPGFLDERAAAFDAEVVAALRTGSPDRLRVDPGLGAELLAAGAPAWNAAAGLVAGSSFDAEVLYEAAPYGVGYVVAVWTARD